MGLNTQAESVGDDMDNIANTSWRFNDELTLPDSADDFYFEIRFDSDPEYSRNGNSYFYLDTYKDHPRLNYRAEGGGRQTVYYWNGSQYEWYLDSLKTIIVYGGKDCQNPTLISWLEANATQFDWFYKVRGVAITATADAIRARGNSSDLLLWYDDEGFQRAINSMVIGSDATAEDFDIVSGKTAIVNNVMITGTLSNANGVSF